MSEEYHTENGAEGYTEMNSEFQQESNFEEHEGKGEPAAVALSGDNSHDDKLARKIFVGGLSWETTVKDMREYFEKYGDVVDCTLKTDPNTGRSRGFGFVTFTDPKVVDVVLAKQPHKLHDRTIDPKRAKARGKPEPIKKVFVGGLDPSVSEQEIRDYFSKYGTVTELDLPFDKVKNQRRAFCFISFESEEVVEAVVENQKQLLNGREVDVKKATPKQEGWGNQGWGGYGGRGGAGGGRGYRGGGQGGQGQGWGQGGWNNGSSSYDYYGGYPQSYGSGYGNYDYSQYNYGNYDYNSYYGQGWGNYNQGSYGSGYGNGYDYSNWYGGQGQQQGDYQEYN